jgi:hypothetical protein
MLLRTAMRLQQNPGSAMFQIKSDLCVDAVICDFGVVYFSGEFLDVNGANVPECLRGFLHRTLRDILPTLAMMIYSPFSIYRRSRATRAFLVAMCLTQLVGALAFGKV